MSGPDIIFRNEVKVGNSFRMIGVVNGSIVYVSVAFAVILLITCKFLSLSLPSIQHFSMNAHFRKCNQESSIRST